MAGIEQLPPLELDGHQPSNPQGADHPMRVMTRRAAGLIRSNRSASGAV